MATLNGHTTGGIPVHHHSRRIAMRADKVAKRNGQAPRPGRCCSAVHSTGVVCLQMRYWSASCRLCPALVPEWNTSSPPPGSVRWLGEV